MNANESARPEPVALCLTRAEFEYHPAATHDDASLFRARQLARLVAAQPWLAQEREAA